jgi:hypothetical protein
MAQSEKDDCPWATTRGTREKRTRTCIMMGGGERVGTLAENCIVHVPWWIKIDAKALKKGMAILRGNQ